jgi:hypothetical protein
MATRPRHVFAAGETPTLIRTEQVPISDEDDRRDQMAKAATSALDVNRTYLALTSPTTAQNVAQIRSLTQQNTVLIRLLLGLLDRTD